MSNSIFSYTKLAILALFSAVSCAAGAPAPMVHGPAVIDTDPQKVAVAFDLHGVVFNTKAGDIVPYFYNNVKDKTKALILLTKMFVKGDILALRKETKVAEHGFNTLVKKYPELDRYRADFINLTNIQEPNLKTVQLIKDLKTNGYTIVLASNIGNQSLADLQKKFPDIMGLFDIQFKVDETSNYFGKPDPKYYTGLKAFVDKKIVFIDDSEKNVKAAADHNISGIVFKDAEQLKKTLVQLNLLA